MELYLMLETTLKFQKAFDMLEIKDGKYREDLFREKMRGVPTEEDWSYARAILPFLKSFYDATLSISGSLYATCNQFVEDILGVGVEINEQCDNNDESIRMMAQKMRRKHEKYWGNINNINVISYVAAVLDPRLKLSYVDFSVREAYDNEKADRLVSKIQYALSNLFVYYESCHERSEENQNTNSKDSVTEQGL